MERSNQIKKITFNTVLNGIEDNLGTICLASMSIVVFVAVIMRYVVKMPFVWGEEIARYLMIWAVYIGVSVCTRKEAHLGIEMLVDVLPAKAKKAAFIFRHGVILVAYICFFILSVLLLIQIITKCQITPAIRMPMWIVYLALPVGFAFSIIREIQVIYNKFFNPQGNAEKEVVNI